MKDLEMDGYKPYAKMGRTCETRDISEKKVIWPDIEQEIFRGKFKIRPIYKKDLDKNVSEKDAAIEAINNGKIVRCGFCSIDLDGEHCAEVVEKEIGGFVRGKRIDEEKHEFANCIICNEPATCTVYIAKRY